MGCSASGRRAVGAHCGLELRLGELLQQKQGLESDHAALRGRHAELGARGRSAGQPGRDAGPGIGADGRAADGAKEQVQAAYQRLLADDDQRKRTRRALTIAPRYPRRGRRCRRGRGRLLAHAAGRLRFAPGMRIRQQLAALHDKYERLLALHRQSPSAAQPGGSRWSRSRRAFPAPCASGGAAGDDAGGATRALSTWFRPSLPSDLRQLPPWVAYSWDLHAWLRLVPACGGSRNLPEAEGWPQPSASATS